jgi:hypothetical protein
MPETERVGKYMIRPLLSLERLSFLEQEGKVGYRLGKKGTEREVMDYLELTFVADKPPPSHVFEQVALTAAEESGEYF